VLRATSFLPDWREVAIAEVWVIAAIASATFWTLITRSTVGGVALTIAAQLFISLALNLVRERYGIEYLSLGGTIAVPTVILTYLCYAGLMLWLGWRTLARFQVTGGMAGDNLVMTGPDVIPRAWAGWLRCRPSEPLLNLIRKELRLLRPVWLITLLAAVGWACLAWLSLAPRRGLINDLHYGADGVGMAGVLIVAILAGSLSLGEEKTSGTHAWQMTLPVSVFRQWLVKLFMALFTGFVCALMVPALALNLGRSLFGAHFVFVDASSRGLWAAVMLLTFASFWCACAENSTVRAVLWVFPVVFTVGFAIEFGEWTAYKLVNLVIFSKFDPFANFRFAVALSNIRWVESYAADLRLVTLILIPTALLAIVQSYGRFRKLQNSGWTLIRNLLSLALLAFLCSFSLIALRASVARAEGEVYYGAVGETHRAIEEILADAALQHTSPPAQLTLNDIANAYRLLAKNARLSEITRRRLRDSSISLTPNKDHPNNQCCGEEFRGFQAWYYVAVVHLASGADLTISYEPSRDPARPVPRLKVLVHWPGAAGQEVLRK
jgi:type II secretory pathway pseudopilin PulG